MGERAIGVSTRALAGLISGLLVVGVLGLGTPATARADSAPVTPTATNPVTVAADALPTVQINGVVWSQVVVGNTVYAAGSFTRARPAGAAPGTQETVRNNLLAYDIRTGELVTSFVPDLNAQARVVAASPDGTRLYVGGDFTQANGQARYRIAAYDTRTGALVPNFAPAVNAQVRALAATDSTVYFGGALTAVGSVSRTRLAAVRASDGGLLPWAPVPGTGPTDGNWLPYFDAEGKPIPGTFDAEKNARTSNEVTALVVTGSGAQVVVAGRFYSLNGTRATGVGALDPISGATRPFAINGLITNHGVNSAVWSLSTDGATVYGTGYDYYGPGNLEGSFAADAAGGRLKWIADCRGDTYSGFATNGALYTASHAHSCINMGGFPEQSPQVFKRATAVSLAAHGRVGTATQRNGNFTGQPAPNLLPWFPKMDAGGYTRQYQAGWNVTGTDRYVVYGGEFPWVNGKRQQGLVRFAMPSAAPNDLGPTTDGPVTVTAVGAGALRVGWQGATDLDNAELTYAVYRDGAATPVARFTRFSQWWQAAPVAWTDRAVPAGSHTYRVTVSDPFGNETVIGSATGSASGTGRLRPYADMLHADGATNYWPMGERSGTTAFDHGGVSDSTVYPGTGLGWAGALKGDSDPSIWFDGRAGYLSTQTPVRGPHTFSVEAWFETRTTAGGKILGFGDQKTGLSNNHDRQLWLDPAGRVHFAVWPGYGAELTSGATYNNGAWHHVVGTVGPTGMSLYVDGRLIASRADTIMAQEITGYWRIGGDRSWSGSNFFNGRLDEVAVYPTVLTADQVARHHALGSTGVVPDAAPTAAFTSVVDGLAVAVDGSSSADAEGPVASYAWDFGDGGTASGARASHTYASAGEYPVTLTVTDSAGSTGRVTRQVTVTGPAPDAAPTAAFTSVVDGLAVAVDGSSSADAEGPVASYAWDFGDGGTASGATASHTYASAGEYPVTLTVTDSAGSTGRVTRQVAVTGPAPADGLVAADAFDREVTGGWGPADLGGNWTVTGSSANAVVTGGSGRIGAVPGGTSAAALPISALDVTAQADVVVDKAPSGNGSYVSLTSRTIGSDRYTTQLRFSASGSVTASLTRLTGGTETVLDSHRVMESYRPGTVLTVRFEVSGSAPATLRAKAWPAGSAEPADWQVTATDATAALQQAGGVRVDLYTSGAATGVQTVRWDDLRVQQPGAAHPPAPDAAPTAAFTSVVDGLAVAVDGSSSADAEGPVASYAWDFGDGGTASGATASHTYASAGEYPVTLTVTDSAGSTGRVTRQVTVTGPAPDAAPTAAFTSVVDGLAVAVDGSSSADAEGPVASYAWDFGDGGTASGARASHTYASAGEYPVTLTVTDSAGSTGRVTRQVAVTGPAPADGLVAADAFDREVTGGWGPADLGGNWTVFGAVVGATVTGGTGVLSAAVGAFLGAELPVAAEDLAVQADVRLDAAATGGGSYVRLISRHVGATRYELRLRYSATGSVTANLLAVVNEVGTVLDSYRVAESYVPGTVLTARFETAGSGTTALRASIWAAGSEQPAEWQLEATDTTAALQRPGAVRVNLYNSTSATSAQAARVDNLSVQDLGATP
ncbi:PKD domain-containing protein [Blastococcus saxobsidens]|uniref:PKD repeat protein n=3 Tax=Blastococcus saxobsidens TaxID=138336 RepID=A0A4Q7YC50_9ACTN|nr:PKD domain-containing protein [Blastococcus saxobsidens]RZU34448.1 PKD repeat protein [Blastococcus saxobsidens]